MNDYLNNFNKIHLFQSVKKTIRAFNMLQKSDAVLIGVSGGPDSVALFHILHLLAPEMSLSLGVAHLNHCLRGKDSDNDEMFVQSLCKQFDLPYYSTREDVLAFKKQHGLSLEEAARRVRYEFYYTTAKENGFNKIALGHHQDDNAELILMHLFRGSGPLGISGIPPIRSLKEDSIHIIRPFIEQSKSQLINFLNKKDIEYVVDASNQDPSHLRNAIRHELLPLLKTTYNPNITETLNRLSSIIRSEETWLEDIIGPLFDQIATRTENQITLRVSDFNRLPEAAQRRILRKSILEIKGNIRRITLSHVDSMIALAKKGDVTSRLDFPDQLRVLKTDDDLMLIQESKPLRDSTPANENRMEPFYSYRVVDPIKGSDSDNRPVNPDKSIQNMQSVSLFIKEINAYLKYSKLRSKDLPNFKKTGQHTAFIDYDKLSFPLLLRNVMAGDRFTPMGMTGKQKLKKYFIDHKIPRHSRTNIPVLLSNEKIVWVVGHRVDDAFKVISTTRNVFKAELLLA